MESGEQYEQALRLGRGVVVAAGAAAPDAWADAPRLTLDDAALRDPASIASALHAHWSKRTPVVVEVACDVGELRAPESTTVPPHSLAPTFEFARERAYFLARTNNYDHRHGRMTWSPALDALRLGASTSTAADVTLPDGTAAWCDGGPRAHHVAVPAGHAIVHRHHLELGVLDRDHEDTPAAVLAPDQQAAVEHAAGPARVIAPAGSGKTRVLTERLRLLVAGRRWHPESITAVAYNVRAKDTMHARLASLGPGVRGRVRTLHSLGNQVLRLGHGQANLLDEWEVRRRIESLVPVRPRANTDVFAPYLEALGEVRLGLVDPEVVEARRDDVAGFAAMFTEYRDKLYADNVIDHDEQIYGALELLLREPEVRRSVQLGCRHLLVDEFQDLTPAQLLLLRLLAAPAYDVFGVGDDDQVIYGYAGADPEFLINYDRYFPGGTHHALERNYRCPTAVVDATRNLLSYNRRRITKTIVAAKPESAPDALAVTRHPPEALAPAALDQVRAWLAGGAEPEAIAVLGRVNAGLLPVQVLLGDAGIPCWTPVSVSVLQRTGTRTALAYLRLATAAAAGAPFAGPDLATAVRRPSRSIRREVLQRLERRRQWRPGQLHDLGGTLAPSAADKFDIFLGDVDSLGRAVGTGTTTAALLTRIRDDIGLGAALASLDVSGKGPDASHRDDLNALIATATSQPDPLAFEAWLRARLPETSGRDATAGVAVSTVHRVKGMEWPYVVVLGAHDGAMPHPLATDLEEERRIFHVAITRADTAVHVFAAADAPVPFVEQLSVTAPPEYFAPPPAPVRTTAAAAKRTAPIPVTAELQGRVDALKAWRKRRATADGVPAYVVLNDTHLAGIATDGPATLDALARCAGIGPTKLERYGDEILAVLAEG